MVDDLNEEELEMIRNLRDRGFAIAVFTPEELGEVDPMRFEDAMVDAGWDAIEALKDE
jgi:hypothetical protein